ncbi:MAG: hypothetical protein Q9191_004105 [Dirinaria sp. TL-2023a]
MDPMLAELNAAQRCAVTSPAAVLQILAPPGSGKTKTLTSRVAYLLSSYSYKPWNIICLTFTIKSAREMKERIARLIGNGMEARLILGTFHSVCRRYLVSYGHLIGIPKGFGIADSSDSISIIRRIIKRLSLHVDPSKAKSRISWSKSRGITCAHVANDGSRKKTVEQQEFYLVYDAYESYLARSNLLDYDDLLLRCVDLLKKHPNCVSNVEVVLIDEFQDTNLVQFDLMRLFASEKKRITTVGDPDQSIYGWRSAETENLRRMQRIFPDTLIILLEDNYRSSGTIILAAREVIEQDESRTPRPLLPTHCPGTVPVLRKLPTAEIEALWIVSEVERCTALTGNLLTYSDCAILLRSASLSRQVESALGRAGIPYRMVGGQRFFDRFEIKLLLDYLRVISQPSNNDALARIINVPPRGIGSATIKSLTEAAELAKTTLWRLILDIVQGVSRPKLKISKQTEQGLASFVHLVLSTTGKLTSANDMPSPEFLLRYIIKKIDFEDYLEKVHEQDYDTRWANVEELLNQAADYPVLTHDEQYYNADQDLLPDIKGLNQQYVAPAIETLCKFLGNVALATEIQREEDCEKGSSAPQSRVTISTIHAAKGLEWPVVFIPSAYEGSIPHSRAEDTDEERRLLYVAMTRAQSLLYLSCPTKNSRREETTLSPFLSSKKVGHFLAKAGPTFNFSAVQDVARILRRGCPSEHTLFESYRTAKNLEDNLWPLSGEEEPEEAQTRWNKRATDEISVKLDPPFKRRRLAGGDKNSNSSTMSVHQGVTCSIGSSTTMENPSAFSHPGGFMTAAALQLTHAECSKDATTTQNKKAKNTQSRKTPLGQSILSNFVGRTPFKEVSVSKSETAFEPSHSLNLGANPVSPKRSATEKGNKTNQPCNSASVNSITSRQSLTAVPQSLANHRLKPLLTTTRPGANPNGDHSSGSYGFLSSSPPNPTSLDQAASDVTETQTDTVDYRRLAQYSAIKPAATYHTTSVAQVRASSNEVRRTLGVKRSMNGWAQRGNKGFTMPRTMNER